MSRGLRVKAFTPGRNKLWRYITRRHLLAGSAAALALPAFARAQGAVKPRLTAISQWSAGSDGAAITALGKKFEEKGGVWQHSPVPGFTTEMMNKLRAQIMAGDPPACSQLKGPEIAAWSKIAPTVDLDAARRCRRLRKGRRAGSRKIAQAGRQVDCAAVADLQHQHAVSVQARDGQGQGRQDPRHMGRLQRPCRKDESGRGRLSHRQRRHPPR